MTSTTGSSETAGADRGRAGGPAQAGSPPSIRAFAAEHKRLTAALLVVVVLLAAAVIVGTLGARISHVTDATSCSGWSAATQAQQQAYATLYVQKHGALPGGARDTASVEDAINTGCIQAFSFDEADTVDVLQAINHQY